MMAKKKQKELSELSQVDLSAYKQQIDNAFAELERLEPTRKKWYSGEL